MVQRLSKLKYLLLIFVFLAGDLSAGINLDELWHRTVKNNYSIMQQNKLLERAEKEVDIQETGYLPKFSASIYGAWLYFQNPPKLFQSSDKDLTASVFSVGLSQPVFTGFRTKNIIELAEHNLTAQTMQKDITQKTLYLETGKLFYNIQSNLVQEQVLTESINRLNNQLTKIRNLMSAQQATAFDTLELANKKLQIITQLSSLKGKTSILMSQLRYLVNDPELPEINTPELIVIDLKLEDLSSYYQIALGNRSELNQISARIKGQNSYTNAVKAAYYPMINLSGGYNKARFDGLIFDGSWIDLYNVFITVQWEFWAWNRDKRKVQQARLESDRLDIASQELIHNIEQQVKTAYQMLEITRDQIYLQDQLVQQEKERFRQTRERHDQGLMTTLDLSSAENDLTAAQLELEKTKILWHQNKLQLDFATGIIGKNLEEN